VIVTRKRRKPFPWKRLILPVIAIALVVFAFAWGPSRNVVANGPLAPVWRASSTAYGAVAKPFNFAAQNEQLTEKNKQIMALEKQVSDLQSQSTAKDKKIGNLTSQVQEAQLQATSPSSRPGIASATPAASASQQNTASAQAGSAFGQTDASSGSDLSQGATADMRRTAQYWGNMEPENAAKLIQRLPVPYVARILALMSPDSVGAILDALPADYAAKLTQDHPELKK
jgi:flagellar motility protein MotE (MotC chaperone)